jgi:hypothetical protein
MPADVGLPARSSVIGRQWDPSVFVVLVYFANSVHRSEQNYANRRSCTRLAKASTSWIVVAIPCPASSRQ